jgi:hypothetical protein
MYGNVNWLNALDELGKIKKGTDIVTMLFVFKSGVVILAQERIKGKRRPRVSINEISKDLNPCLYIFCKGIAGNMRCLSDLPSV